MILRVPPLTEPRVTTAHPIAALAEKRLRSSSHSSLRGIACTFDRGRLILQGRLSCFYHKQLAQEIVAHLDGVEQVVNQIEVHGKNPGRGTPSPAP